MRSLRTLEARLSQAEKALPKPAMRVAVLLSNDPDVEQKRAAAVAAGDHILDVELVPASEARPWAYETPPNMYDPRKEPHA